MSTLMKSPINGNETSTQKSLSSWVDNFFENGLGTGFLSNFNTGITLPAVNIKENADEYILELAIPGMKKSDFNIDLDNKVLSISSEVETEVLLYHVEVNTSNVLLQQHQHAFDCSVCSERWYDVLA